MKTCSPLNKLLMHFNFSKGSNIAVTHPSFIILLAQTCNLNPDRSRLVTVFYENHLKLHDSFTEHQFAHQK